MYQASEQYPVYITAGNFTNKDTYDAIPSLFLPDQNGKKKEFPAFGRDDMFKQMISLRKKFTDYKSFATATMNDILTPEQQKTALRLKANQLKSCFLRNDGNGKFTLIPLPIEAQFSALNGMETGDFDGDGNLDVVINGNDFGTEIATGRYDALNGLMLKNDGKGGFKPLSILQSGIYIPGDGRALVKLRDTKGNLLLAASQHSDSLQLFKLQSKIKIIPVKYDDVYALIKHKNGSVTKQEFYYGSSFLSQSGRTVEVDQNVQSVTVFDTKNQQRILKLN
ncbi:MAG: FG-GAP repeat domain-containing protein [Janthinobacterium lividum]